MKMKKTKGYSLWLMPSEDVYNRLAELISQLSKKYSTPNFEPHATLIGKIIASQDDIINKTLQLATIVKPFTILLTKTQYLDEYFKFVFIKVEETDDLMKVNLEARKIFKREGDPEYMPHLSLIYGNFSSETKQKIIKFVGKEFNLNFDVRSIHLVSTNGEPEDWYKVKEFILK
jgi:2'-5' RNA ligase